MCSWEPRGKVHTITPYLQVSHPLYPRPLCMAPLGKMKPRPPLSSMRRDYMGPSYKSPALCLGPAQSGPTVTSSQAVFFPCEVKTMSCPTRHLLPGGQEPPEPWLKIHYFWGSEGACIFKMPPSNCQIRSFGNKTKPSGLWLKSHQAPISPLGPSFLGHKYFSRPSTSSFHCEDPP